MTEHSLIMCWDQTNSSMSFLKLVFFWLIKQVVLHIVKCNVLLPLCLCFYKNLSVPKLCLILTGIALNFG